MALPTAGSCMYQPMHYSDIRSPVYSFTCSFKKKCNTLVVSGKFQMRNIWSPQTRFSCGRFLLPSGSRKAILDRAGKLNDQKQFLAISKWQEHLNKKLKRSLEIPIDWSIYLQYPHTCRHIDVYNENPQPVPLSQQLSREQREAVIW